jgi:hypothetical protein
MRAPVGKRTRQSGSLSITLLTRGTALRFHDTTLMLCKEV